MVNGSTLMSLPYHLLFLKIGIYDGFATVRFPYPQKREVEVKGHTSPFTPALPRGVVQKMFEKYSKND